MVNQERGQADRLASESLDEDGEKTSDEEDGEGRRQNQATELTRRPQVLNQRDETSNTNSKISSIASFDTNQRDEQDAHEDKYWRRTRIHVALLGLAIAVVNCYAQATFCIAIVEMVIPSDYLAESGPGSGFGLQTSGPNSTSIDQSCPIEFKYRSYYDDWRFDTNETTSSSVTTATGGMERRQLQQQLDTSNRFDWDASQQGLLLGAFAMGTAPLQILGGRMAEIYGAKWVLLMGCIGTGLTNLAIPYLAHFSLLLLIVNRILMGVAQAGMEPGLMCLLADWLTPQEASFFISMLLFALCLGFFLGSLCSSFILALGYGWPLTYYVCAGLNLLVALLWYIYADSWPRASRHISRQELAYIESEQARAKLVAGGHKLESASESEPQNGPVRHEDPLRTPWMNILRSRPVWAFIICKISIRWCADVMSNELPTYLANVLHLSIKINGLLNSVSSALFAISSFITGWLATSNMFTTPPASFNPARHDAACCSRLQVDHDEEDGRARGARDQGKQCSGCQQDQLSLNARKTNLRKTFQSLASFGSAICLILMAKYDCDIPISMGCLLLLSCFIVMGSGGELQIAYDMTLRYPGTLHGMACTLSVSGWLAPPLYGLILGDQPNSRTRWSLVWYSTAAINLLGGLVFVLFADASPRDFDHRAKRRQKSAAGKRRNLETDLEQDGGYFNGALSGSSCESSPKSSHQHKQKQQQQQADERNLAASKLNPLEANISFDCGRLVRCRQLESSFMPTKLDSPLWLKADDLIYPYREQAECASRGGGLTGSQPRTQLATGAKRGTWRQMASSLPFSSRFKFRASMETCTTTVSGITASMSHVAEARNDDEPTLNERRQRAAKSISELANSHSDETINQQRGSQTSFRSAAAAATSGRMQAVASGCNLVVAANNGVSGAHSAAGANSMPYCTAGPYELPGERPIGAPEALLQIESGSAARQKTITHL